MVLLMRTLYFVIAIADPRSHFAIAMLLSACRDCCCGVPVALGGKDIIVTEMLIEDVLTLLMLQKDC